MSHLLLLPPALAPPVYWLWPLPIAVSAYAVTLALSVTVYVAAMTAMRRPRMNSVAGLLGRVARVAHVDSWGLPVQLGGEYWGADAEGWAVRLADEALVTGFDGLRLQLRSAARA